MVHSLTVEISPHVHGVAGREVAFVRLPGEPPEGVAGRLSLRFST